MKKVREQVYESSQIRLFEALRRAVVEMHAVSGADSASRLLTFTSKTPGGCRINMTGIVVDGGGGTSRLAISSGNDEGSAATEADADTAAQALLERVGKVLPETSDAHPGTVTAAQTAAGALLLPDLERLVALRALGALNDAEFENAKAQVLASPPANSLAAQHGLRLAPAAGAFSGGAGGTGGQLGAAAAGAAGGYLLASASEAQAYAVADGPTEVDYHGSIEGPGGESITYDGTLTETVSVEDGVTHVEVVDHGTVGMDGETYTIDDSYEATFDAGEVGGDEEGGLFGLLGDLFG